MHICFELSKEYIRRMVLFFFSTEGRRLRKCALAVFGVLKKVVFGVIFGSTLEVGNQKFGQKNARAEPSFFFAQEGAWLICGRSTSRHPSSDVGCTMTHSRERHASGGSSLMVRTERTDDMRAIISAFWRDNFAGLFRRPKCGPMLYGKFTMWFI